MCIFFLNACMSADDNVIIDTGIKATLPETIDAYLNTNLSSDEPGVSILVRKNGELIYKNVKGLANKSNRTPISHETGFRLASISKPFAALVIMQFYEQKSLLLDDSILSFLPELPQAWQEITIHQLLTCRSGIPDFLNDLHLEKTFNDINNQDVLDYFVGNSELEFTPDSQSKYSNSGYLLLAEIIERISGQRFEDYMINNFFIQNGMLNSYIADEFSFSNSTDALNYAESSQLWGINIYTNGSDGQISSIDDMDIFVQSLLSNSIVSADTLNLMRKVYSNLEQGNYGYGFFRGARFEDSFTAGGSMDGFNSILIIEPSIKLEYIGLSNGGELTGNHLNNIYALINRFYSQN
jgi:D-alanyl-D-alanine carboxypeptidase